MTIPYLAAFKKKISSLSLKSGGALTYHERLVLFWVRLVVVTGVGMVIIICLSLGMWWVTPSETSAELIEVLPEEKPQLKDGEYDVAKAEKIIKMFEERRVSAPARN